MKEQNNISYLKVFFIIFLVLFFFFPALFFYNKYFINKYLDQISFSNQKDIIIKQPKNVVIKEEQRIKEVISSIDDNIISIFQKKLISSTTSQENINLDIKDNYYFKEDLLGIGFVFTNDSWMITNYFSDQKLDKKKYIFFDNDLNDFRLSKIFFDDDSEFSFCKLSGDFNFQAPQIKNKSDIITGQSVIISNQNKEVFFSSILSFEKNNIVLQNNIPDNFIFSPVFALDGTLIALVKSNKELYPAYILDRNLKEIFDDKQISEKKSLEIDKIVFLEDIITVSGKNYSNGVLVLENNLKEGLDFDFIKGDVITEIDNIKITKKNDIDDILSYYRKGDNVVIKYIRDNIEKETNYLLK